jgi:methylaspartate ammonia-lyase
MKVRGEQLYVGGAVASGFAAALEYDRAGGCDPFFEFRPEKASGVCLSGC